MATELDIDLSFLDDFDSSIADFVSRLFHCRVLVLDNDLPDVCILELDGAEGVDGYISQHFKPSESVTHMIIPNSTRLSSDICTHFRLVLLDHNHKSPVNYKMDHFLKKIGHKNVSSRCRLAMVVAMMGSTSGVFINVPLEHCHVLPPALKEFSMVDIVNGPIDYCHHPGIALPCSLPDEIKWKILGYCQSPDATCIKKEMDRINSFWTYWDTHFRCLGYPWFVMW
jgi:hypothetical protein